MGAPPRIDWARATTDYVTGADDVTTFVIAERYGVRPETVRRWAAKLRWTDQRRQYRHMAAQKTMQAASTVEAEIRARHVNLGKQVQGIALTQLQKLAAPRHEKILGDDGQMKLQVVASLLQEQMDAPEVRRWLESGVRIEREAAGLEEEIRIRVEGELEAALRRLQVSLDPDTYRRVLDVLSDRSGS